MPEVVDLEILSRVKSEAINVGIFLNERRAKKWKNNLKWERGPEGGDVPRQRLRISGWRDEPWPKTSRLGRRKSSWCSRGQCPWWCRRTDYKG